MVLIKIVVEEYINHINPSPFQFRLAPASFANEPWYRRGSACAGEGEEQQLPTSPVEEGGQEQEQGQEGGEAEQDGGGGD